MDALAWMLTNGPLVWKAALGLLTLGGIAASHVGPRIAARVEARGARRRLGAPLADARLEAAEAGKELTLRGRLEASGDGGALAIRVGDQVIAIEGAITVTAGSSEDRRGRSPLRTVGAGDVVRLRGVLRDEAANDGRSYREAARSFRLEAAPAGAITAAFDGAPGVRGPGAIAYARGALMGATLFAVTFGAGGEIAFAAAERDLHAMRFEGGAPRLGAIAVALASPIRRDAALRALGGALDAARREDPAVIALRASIHERAGEPEEAARLLASQGNEEQGARRADTVGAHDLAAHAWYAIGDFDRAGDAWERGGGRDPVEHAILGLEAGLLASKPSRGAKAARALAEALRSRPANSLELTRWYEGRAALAECIAESLEGKLGASDGRRCGAWPSGSGCALLLADAVSGSERIARIQAIGATGGHEVPSRWMDLLRAEADPAHADAIDPAFDVAASALASPGTALPLSVPGLERSLAIALEIGPEGDGLVAARSTAAASAALFAMTAGDLDEARRFARRHADDERALAVRAGPKDRAHAIRARRALELGAAIEVAAGDLDAAHALAIAADQAAPGGREASHSQRGLAGLLAFRRDGDARLILDFLAVSPPPDEDEKRAWSFAAAGDGAALAAWLRRPWSDAGAFVRIGAPRITSGRDELMGWIAWGHRAPGIRRPVAQLVHLVNLAAAAEALGDVALARRRKAQAERFRKAILRRDLAIPLALVERF